MRYTDGVNARFFACGGGGPVLVYEEATTPPMLPGTDCGCTRTRRTWGWRLDYCTKHGREAATPRKPNPFYRSPW